MITEFLSNLSWDFEAIKLVKETGFPILVAVFFMFRSDKKSDKTIDLLHEIIKNQLILQQRRVRK